MLVVSGEVSIFSYLGFHFYWGQCSHIKKGLWAVIGTQMVDLLLANKKCKHLRHGLGRRKGLWFLASDPRTGISFRQSQVPTEGLETSQELTKPPLPGPPGAPSCPQNAAWTPQDMPSCSQSDRPSRSSPATLYPPDTLPACRPMELHRDHFLPLHCPFSSKRRKALPTFMAEFQFHTALSKQRGYHVAILSVLYIFLSEHLLYCCVCLLTYLPR